MTGPEAHGAGMFEERVPVTVAMSVQRALGADLGDVTVRRGPDVTELTHRLGARGFTEDRVVYVPDDVGALDSSSAAPLLAHELTHVVQQRAFGAALPGPDTHLGQQLEEDAVRIEDWMAGGAVTVAPTLVHPAPRAAQRASGAVLRELLNSDAMRRIPQTDARHLVREFERTSGLMALTPDARTMPEFSVRALLDAAMADDEPDTGGDDPGGDGPGGGKGGPGWAGDPAAMAAIAEAVAELFADEPPRRWFDLDDVDDFEELAGRVYQELLDRLRLDMVVDRERSGTLLDFA